MNKEGQCRGSYKLGTACGKCDKCREERKQLSTVGKRDITKEENNTVNRIDQVQRMG